MKYNELVAISGLSGLYQLMSTKSDGAIVKNLDDNTTKFVAARSHNVTPLDSIEVFTMTDNIRLYEVFQSFKVHEGEVESMDVSKSDNKTITKLFATLFPEYDKDRVYVSNMRKLFSWYNNLQSTGNLKVAEEETETAEETKETKIPTKAEKAAVKKPASRDTAKAKTSAGVKKTSGVRKTGTA